VHKVGGNLQGVPFRLLINIQYLVSKVNVLRYCVQLV
jgi:hypothetical protein